MKEKEIAGEKELSLPQRRKKELVILPLNVKKAFNKI